MHLALPYPRRYSLAAGILIFLLASVIAARLYLNTWLLDYVNNVLKTIPGYEGSADSIDIALYRGAYRVHGLKLYKKTGDIPTPFISIDTTDLSIQWGALFHGRIVSDADLVRPVLNFAVGRSGETEQTGAGVDWSKPIKDLMPIDINLVTFREGKLTYQDFSTNPKVNIYIHNMKGELRNLRNVVDASKPLPSWIKAEGDSIGGGTMKIRGRMNILKPTPDMDMNVKLENVDLRALSDYSNAYAAIDIRKGELDVYSEFVVKDNRINGYIKPIATHMSLIDLSKQTNPVKLVWETLVATVVEIFHNQPRDQFATKIPISGSLDNVETNGWSTLAGIVRNAFISAFKKKLDHDIKFDNAP